MKYPSLTMSLLLLLGTELLLRSLKIPDYLLPLPSQVFQTLLTERQELWVALWDTGTHALYGLGLSILSGFSMAILVSLSPWLRAGILPLALFFQTVPIIAIAPMLVIWFGFGPPTVIAASTIVSFFPMLASTLQGLEATPKASLELFALYQSSRWNLYRKLKIPYSIPFIYGGLKIATGLAVVGTLVGEFIGGGGLGSLIDSARTQQRTDLVFAAVLMSCFLGWILTTSLELLRVKILKNWLR